MARFLPRQEHNEFPFHCFGRGGACGSTQFIPTVETSVQANESLTGTSYRVAKVGKKPNGFKCAKCGEVYAIDPHSYEVRRG